MLTKTITYIDYNGNERKEDFYFNLNKAEVMEMEMSTSGGLVEMVKRIVAAQDGATLIKIFKELVLKSYGVKSPDGKRFIKSEELSTEFSQTEAYVQVFMELATDDEKAHNFIMNVFSGDIDKEAVEKELEKQKKLIDYPSN